MVQSGPGSRADALECAVKTQSQAGEEQHRKEIDRNQRVDQKRKVIAAVSARKIIRNRGQEHKEQAPADSAAAIGAGTVSDRDRWNRFAARGALRQIHGNEHAAERTVTLVCRKCLIGSSHTFHDTPRLVAFRPSRLMCGRHAASLSSSSHTVGQPSVAEENSLLQA